MGQLVPYHPIPYPVGLQTVGTLLHGTVGPLLRGSFWVGDQMGEGLSVKGPIVLVPILLIAIHNL